jgi:hypothetical protein
MHETPYQARPVHTFARVIDWLEENCPEQQIF